MGESIVVNGVVFTVLEGHPSIWRNGDVYIEHLPWSNELIGRLEWDGGK